MTGIVGWFVPESDDIGGRLDVALDTIRSRGSDAADTILGENGAVGVARYDWECHPAFGGPAEVATCGEWVAVADATLYYLPDLHHRLRQAAGTEGLPDGMSVTDLILHAYRLGGVQALEWLEGDYAFIVWNRNTGEVFAARDFVGKRPLYWVKTLEGLALSSTVEGAVSASGIKRTLDIGVLAWNAAGIPSPGQGTAYGGVSTLPAGHWLRWRPNRECEVSRWWHVPADGGTAMGSEDAAQVLRQLLIEAVSERAGADATAVWQSGGMDSSAVMGAGRSVRGNAAWSAVSVSYPQGDPGHEDEIIEELAQFCDVPVSWLASRDLPILDWSSPNQAPFAHAFEGMLRGLAGASRDTGSRVVLDGYGGDQLFQTSDVYLADLVRQGKLISLIREWGHPRWRTAGPVDFLRWALKPALPASVRKLVASARRRTTRGHLDRVLPPWVRAGLKDLPGDNGLLSACAREPGESHSDHEMRWYLTDPYFPAISSVVAQMGLEAGVEVRSPLIDQRVVQFARTRPAAERVAFGRTKRLLRQAMAGLLPSSALEHRLRKGGTTEQYFARTLRADAGTQVQSLFRESRLADLGVIDVAVFLRWWEWFSHGEQGPWDVPLLATIQVERWLQDWSDDAAPRLAGQGLAAAAL